MRNNINGDFSIVKKISELKPGAFININWNKKTLMLPYSLRKDYISFTDKKWDWRYQFNKDGSTDCLLYTSPSPRDKCRSRMPSSA